MTSLPTTVVDLEKIDPSFAGIWKQIDVYSPSEGYLATQTKGIYLRDAYLEKRLGVPDTAKDQAFKLMTLLRFEVARSKVYRTVLQQIFNSNSVINIFLGKNSAAFVDSADQWTLDFDDLLSLPIDPVTVHIHDHHRAHNPTLCSAPAELKCGVTQGELLLHILEERYYMGRAGNKYTEAHLRCLSPGSYQNQYRKEQGLLSDLTLMAIHEDGVPPLINDRFVPFDHFTHSSQGYGDELYDQSDVEIIPADLTLDKLSPNSDKPRVALLFTALASMPVEVLTTAENVMEIGQKNYYKGDFVTLDSLGIVTQLGKIEISKAEFPRDDIFVQLDTRKLSLTMHVLDFKGFTNTYIQNKIDILTREIVVKKRIPPMDFPPILLLKHMYEHVHGKDTEAYTKAVDDFFSPMVIHYARRQAWTLLNSKFKIIKHGGVFRKLCDLPYLIQSARDQMSQTCDRTGVVLVPDWRATVPAVPQIEADITLIKTRLVATLTGAFNTYAECISPNEPTFKLGNEQLIIDALADVI